MSDHIDLFDKCRKAIFLRIMLIARQNVMLKRDNPCKERRLQIGDVRVRILLTEGKERVMEQCSAPIQPHRYPPRTPVSRRPKSISGPNISGPPVRGLVSPRGPSGRPQHFIPRASGSLFRTCIAEFA